jgi:pimeloyl-ACP methyl ester carboxylesterase
MGARRSRSRGFAIALVVGVVALLVLGALFPRWALEAEYARLRWKADASEKAVVVDGRRIVYLEAGEGESLVLLHGFTGSKENWLPMLPHLSKRWRVIAPDLPGWGDSERVAGEDYGYAAQAARVAQLLAALDANASVLVGHSMGGGIAAIVAARYPKTLSRLVLMDAGGAMFRENEFGRAVRAGENPFAVSDRASLDRQLNLVFDEPPFVPWPADQALIAQRIADADFEADVLERIGRGPDAFLPISEAASIGAPTLLLWCARDRIIDASAAEIYHQAIEGSHIVMLEQCNHMPMMERPIQTAAALEDFLK